MTHETSPGASDFAIDKNMAQPRLLPLYSLPFPFTHFFSFFLPSLILPFPSSPLPLLSNFIFLLTPSSFLLSSFLRPPLSALLPLMLSSLHRLPLPSLLLPPPPTPFLYLLPFYQLSPLFYQILNRGSRDLRHRVPSCTAKSLSLIPRSFPRHL